MFAVCVKGEILLLYKYLGWAVLVQCPHVCSPKLFDCGAGCPIEANLARK